MANTNMSKQFLHVALVEDIRNKTVSFSEVEFFVMFGHYASSILTSMLEHSQAIVECLIHVRTVSSNYSDDTAHVIPCVETVAAPLYLLRLIIKP